MSETRILIVEDESVLAYGIKQLLERREYTVTGIADTGEEAIQQAESTRPDLVLMDIRLKGQMDGFMATEEIRARFGIPVVYLTAHADPKTLEQASASEPFGYVVKPFEEIQLHAAVEIALAKRRAEQALQAEIAERTRAEKAEHEQRTLAEALRDTASALSSTLDLDEVLDRILANAGRVVPHDTTNIMLLEERKWGSATVARARGYDEFGLEEWIYSIRLPVAGLPTLRQMAETGNPLVIPDTQDYADWVDLPESRWIRSYAGAPIQLEERVIGFLNLESPTPNFFTPDHGERLQALADQAAIAIGNARVFERAQRHASELEALRRVTLDITAQLDLTDLLQAVVENIDQLLDVESSGICLYQPERDVLEWTVSVGDSPVPKGTTIKRGEDLAGKVWEIGKPLTVEKYAEWKGRSAAFADYPWSAVVGVPIYWSEEFLGVVVAVAGASKPPFSDEDAHLLNMFATQAAVAIHNARSYKAEQRERVLAQTLQRTAHALAQSVHLGRTLDLIVDQLRLVKDYSWAAMMLVEDDALRIVAARGFANQADILDSTLHYPDIPLLHDGLTSEDPIVLPDVQANPEWASMPAFPASTRSWVGVPLVAWDVVTGFLSIGSDQPDAFGAADVEAVRAFARQAAVAAENARLTERLEASLSELQEAQHQIKRTARLSAAGEMAAGVAHQINNPLTAIMAQTSLMLTDLAPDTRPYNSAMIIQKAAQRAGTVVQRLLDFSRETPYTFLPVGVTHSIENSIALVRAQFEPRVHIVTNFATGLPPIEASEEHLHDVWLNLLLNAVDAIGEMEDGVITVTTRHDPEANAIEVSIQDNGIGIPAEHLEQIFEPFFTTKEHGYGTGLGLSICHEVVEHHRGSIQVHSEGVPGLGTTFTVTLPCDTINAA